MQNKILKNTMLSCIVAVLLSIFTCLFVFSKNLQQTMNQQAYSQTMLLVHILENSKDDPVITLEKIKSEIYGRITFVDRNGDVVYDSDYNISDLASHADRQEIIEANENGVAINQRMSDTADKITYYCAAKVENMGVIRVGVMSATLATDVFITSSPTIWLCLVIFVVCVLLFSNKTTHRIVNTIENYDIETGEGEIYDELSHFVTKIKSQNDIIKRQVQSLTDEKRKLQSVFMNISEGIIVCNSQKEIIQTNFEAQSIFDINESETNFDNAIKVSELQQGVEKALQGEAVQTLFNYDGCRYQAIISPNTSDNGVILIILDISQQVENENARRQFTDNVTHELKTPLTSILGYSQLITNDIAKAEDVKKFVGIIENNAETLMEMINDIINISKLESGDGFSKVQLKLNEIIVRAAEQEKIIAEKRNIVINTDVETIHISADEGQMYQLAHNLISNAVKYNKDNGAVNITLKKDGNNAVLTVSDTGIGVPKEYHEKIYERFYVVDKARNKNISSTGLGLSIVKHVVKAHNGVITMKSQQGKGTEFTVKLPIE